MATVGSKIRSDQEVVETKLIIETVCRKLIANFCFGQRGRNDRVAD